MTQKTKTIKNRKAVGLDKYLQKYVRKGNSVTRSRRYSAEKMTDADCKDDQAFLANTPNQTKSLQQSMKQATGSIGLIGEHK